ncbi:MAG: hypoxanthine phosphoribosyltransferase [Rhodospirillaceae bacterium]|nr:hypoxanthine phosphoribosyltransferase [Rhodospirillaceae bacterium]|tara:strand:- start:10984 stop:11526 length:543 start_codon:yes stop_codon:yes gene_type:complete
MTSTGASPEIKTLFSADQIAERVDTLAKEIVADETDELLVVIILKGSFVFAADLVRALERNGASAQVDFVTLSSYGMGTESSGSVNLTHDLSEDVAGRSILIVDDILESGRTIAFAVETLQKRGASSVKTCLLLDKPTQRKVSIEADYVGFTIDPEFVVGYGLDLAKRYRGLPYIGVVQG